MVLPIPSTGLKQSPFIVIMHGDTPFFIVIPQQKLIIAHPAATRFVVRCHKLSFFN
jgi:hypothetical protein